MASVLIPHPGSQLPPCTHHLTTHHLTMKLWVLSDLHLDVNRRVPFTLPEPHPEHDAVVSAGDICQGIGAGVRFIVDAGLNATPVLYVAGNHEYYGGERHAGLTAGRAEAAGLRNTHLLERDSVVIGGV